MRLTGAHIRIEGGTRQDESNDRGMDERLVTITGTDAQQYKVGTLGHSTVHKIDWFLDNHSISRTEKYHDDDDDNPPSHFMIQ